MGNARPRIRLFNRTRRTLQMVIMNYLTISGRAAFVYSHFRTLCNNRTILARSSQKVGLAPSSLSQIKYRYKGLFADISKNDIFGKEATNEKVYS